MSKAGPALLEKNDKLLQRINGLYSQLFKVEQKVEDLRLTLKVLILLGFIASLVGVFI